MAVDDTYAKIEKEKQDAHEKDMAALKQAKEKDNEKERSLIYRGDDLQCTRSDLLTKLHIVKTSIEASDAARIQEEKAAVAKIRMEFMKKHESRVKEIKKECGYDYDEECARLQELEDDIRSNDAERKVTLS